MKRVFALALAICMALSMMVLTASAALPQEVACTEHPEKAHWKYTILTPSEPNTFYGDYYDTDDTITERHFGTENFAIGSKPENDDIGKWWIFNSEGDLQKCPGNHGPQSQPQPQPKTGVMDTLPIWFGVMAVSACAYVLTSKKKVF